MQMVAARLALVGLVVALGVLARPRSLAAGYPPFRSESLA